LEILSHLATILVIVATGIVRGRQTKQTGLKRDLESSP